MKINQHKVIYQPQYKRFHAWFDRIKSNEFNAGKVLQTGRNVVTELTLDDASVVVKSYKVPNFLQAFIYGYLRPSKASRSFYYSARLNALSITNPKAMAFSEYRWLGCLRNSYYVSEYWPHDYNLTTYFDSQNMDDEQPKLSKECQQLITELVNFTYSQHQAGVQHLDYNPSNILIRKKSGAKNCQFEFAIIDLNRMAFKPLNLKQRAKGLIHLSSVAVIRDQITQAYAKRYEVDPTQFSALVAKIQAIDIIRRNRRNKFKALFK